MKYSALEDPDYNPTLDMLERVAAALGTRLEVDAGPSVIVRDTRYVFVPVPRERFF